MSNLHEKGEGPLMTVVLNVVLKCSGSGPYNALFLRIN